MRDRKQMRLKECSNSLDPCADRDRQIVDNLGRNCSLMFLFYEIYTEPRVLLFRISVITQCFLKFVPQRAGLLKVDVFRAAEISLNDEFVAPLPIL